VEGDGGGSRAGGDGGGKGGSFRCIMKAGIKREIENDQGYWANRVRLRIRGTTSKTNSAVSSMTLRRPTGDNRAGKANRDCNDRYSATDACSVKYQEAHLGSQ
jgi:hypothetical protein